MEPIVNGLEQEFSGQLQVMRLDADDPVNEQLMQDLGLRGHPSFAVIDAQGHSLRKPCEKPCKTCLSKLRCGFSRSNKPQ